MINKQWSNKCIFVFFWFCLALVLGHNPFSLTLVHVHIILIHFCCCCLIQWFELGAPPSPLPSFVCPSNLLGLTKSLFAASLPNVQPFDFLKQLCSQAKTFSSLLLSITYMQKKCIKTNSALLLFFFFAHRLHAESMDDASLDGVLVQQSKMVTAKI